MLPQIVIDTNVLVAAIQSQHGASFALLERLEGQSYELHLSHPVVTEYREVLMRFSDQAWCSPSEVEALINLLCRAGRLHGIHFLLRPSLPDPRDERFLELAVAGGAQFIVTYNRRHFQGIERYGVEAVTPLQFLRILGGHG